MTKYWITCPAFTVQVTTDENDRIVEAAPIVRKFIGQHIQELVIWASLVGGETRVEILR